MFQKDKVTQSMIDAVNQVLGEAKVEPSKPDPEAIARKKKLDALRDKQDMDKAEKGSSPSATRKIAGHSYGGAKQKDDEMDEEVKLDEAEMDESGLRMAAHAAHKAGQKEFEFKGKKYPVRVSEDGKVDCDYSKVKAIAKKEVQHHNVTMHKGQKSSVEEEMTFASKLKSMLEGKGPVTGAPETFTDMNMQEKEMTDAQMKKREKIVMSMKDKTAEFKSKYGKNWKNVMYATATKQAMKEEDEKHDDEKEDKKLIKKMVKKDCMKEEEQLVELDPKTLTSYIKKSGSSLDKSHNAANKAYKKYDDTGDDKDIAAGDKAYATYNKRHAGISTALKKLNKKAKDSSLGEEVEQLDELDPKTLASYAKRSAHDARIKQTVARDFLAKSNTARNPRKKETWSSLSKKYQSGAWKREKGHDLAVDKLTKTHEEVELDEANVTHAAHFADPKSGKWTSMALITAKDDKSAIAQAHDLAKSDAYSKYKLSSVEKHVTVPNSGDKKMKEETIYEANPAWAPSVDKVKEINGGADKRERSVDMLRGRFKVPAGREDVGPGADSKNSKVKDITLVKTEEVEINEGKMKDIYTSMMIHADKKGYSSHKEFTPKDYDAVGKEHGISGKDLAVIAGHKTASQVAKEEGEGSWSKETPWHKSPGTVTDKSGAKHSPMSRVKDIAKQALKKVKKETMMGKLGTSE